jgi:hypothetical protein
MKTHTDKCTFGTPEADPTFPCTCDGYHTFDELYDHRITLYIALCAAQRLFTDKEIWRSKRHSDGELCFGTGSQFVLGIGSKAGEQITYHIPIERWDEATFALTYEKAPEWDGHSSEDVLTRLKML